MRLNEGLGSVQVGMRVVELGSLLQVWLIVSVVGRLEGGDWERGKSVGGGGEGRVGEGREVQAWVVCFGRGM